MAAAPADRRHGLARRRPLLAAVVTCIYTNRRVYAHGWRGNTTDKIESELRLAMSSIRGFAMPSVGASFFGPLIPVLCWPLLLGRRDRYIGCVASIGNISAGRLHGRKSEVYSFVDNDARGSFLSRISDDGDCPSIGRRRAKPAQSRRCVKRRRTGPFPDQDSRGNEALAVGRRAAFGESCCLLHR